MAVTTGERSADHTEVFNALIQPALGTGFALACAMLRDREAAEDAVQEAAIKAWRNAWQVTRPGSSPRAWFLRIVANQCRDTRRTGWWRVLRLGELQERTQADHAERVVEELDIDRAMAHLSREQRAVLFLRYRLDLQPSEIAELLSLRSGTVKSRLHRALRKLQVEMSPGFRAGKEELDD